MKNFIIIENIKKKNHSDWELEDKSNSDNFYLLNE